MITLSPVDATGLRQIRGVGELTHRIMPYLIALNRGDKARFADEELIALLFAAAEDYGLGQALERAWRSVEALKLQPQD